MKKRYKIIFKTTLILLVIFIGLTLINSYFGWYGYRMWEQRMGTFGDKSESISRNVFTKDLEYTSNIHLHNFKPYIEKGYWCGVHSLEKTCFKNDTKYPYQISLNTVDTISNVEFTIINAKKFDSINSRPLLPIIYLKKPVLKDTIVLKILTFNLKHDSIGYIKIWNK